jgi:hypothetical protein
MPVSDTAVSSDVGVPQPAIPASADERTDDRADVPDAADLQRTQDNPSDASGVADIPFVERRGLWLSPPSIDFGFVAPDTTPPPQTLTITAKIDFADVSVVTSALPSMLTFAGQCGPLTAGSSCIVDVTLHAGGSTGTRQEILNIKTTASSIDWMFVPVTAQVQDPGQLVIEPSTLQTLYAYPDQRPPLAMFTICNSADTAMSLTIRTSGAFTATATGCDLVARGECCSIKVVGGSSYSEGSLDVTTSTPYPQSVSVPLVSVPVNI